MIPVHIYSFLEVQEEWPTELPCRPSIDDVIEAKSGLGLQVKHVMFTEMPDRKGVWGLKIEVGANISQDDFKKWYSEWKKQQVG